MISPSINKKLTQRGRNVLQKFIEEANLSASDEQMLELELDSEMKSPGLHVLLAILFPINHFLNKQVGKGLLFWFTGGGLTIWYLCHIFTAHGNARKANDAAAMNITSRYRRGN